MHFWTYLPYSTFCFCIVSDYDCLIAENGDLTMKYFKAKEIIHKYAGEYGKYHDHIKLHQNYRLTWKLLTLLFTFNVRCLK